MAYPAAITGNAVRLRREPGSLPLYFTSLPGWEATLHMLSTEAMVRLGFFVGVLAVMVLWEALAPRRQPTVRTRLRWLNNLGLGCLNTLALRFVVPLGAMGVALFARERGWGLFNNVPIPDWLAVIFSVIILDLALYLQHVLFHAVPFLWRFHRFHHADLDIDAITGLRFT